MDNYENYDTDKLIRFVNAVNTDVDKEVESILDEAEKIKEHILDEAKAESETAAKAKLDEAVKKIQSKYMKLSAKAELEGKKSVLKEREVLAKAVFENVRNRLLEFRNTKDYIGYLVRMAKCADIGSEGIICLRKEDMKYTSEIEKALDFPCRFKEDNSIKIGGLSVLYEENGVIDDKTLDLAFEDSKSGFHSIKLL